MIPPFSLSSSLTYHDNDPGSGEKSREPTQNSRTLSIVTYTKTDGRSDISLLDRLKSIENHGSNEI